MDHSTSSKRRRRRAGIAAAIILLLLLLVLVLLLRGMLRPGVEFMEHSPGRRGVPSALHPADTLSAAHSGFGADAETVPAESGHAELPPPEKKVVSSPAGHFKDTTPSRDTLQTGETPAADTATGATPTILLTNPCEQDTILPWAYPDPSGGLHRRPKKIVFHSNKPCKIEWKFKTETEWKRYEGRPVAIETTSTLCFRAHDSCGNAMDIREEFYEITVSQSTSFCPTDMEYISVGQSVFCIDRFEWPNREEEQPRAYVSVYHAMDSCAAAGKRLCSSDEWTIACAGAYGWNYPYGRTYEPRACVTQDTTAWPSGRAAECRGYFDIYDMAGNLAEWTGTRSRANQQFYNVMGGFWESGPQSGCFDVRYSYYPQNRHNPVGFRCCKDVKQTDGK
jgi:hypothetical protein